MPTGYTAQIKDGISFQNFALSCARAFGALVTMRDNPQDVEIPDVIEPDTSYHFERLVESEAKLKALEACSTKELDRMAEIAYQKDLKEKQGWLRDAAKLKGKYEAMLAEVSKWNPPTEEHEGLKRFMIEQIESSIRHDCLSKEDIPMPKKMTGMEYYNKQKEALEWTIKYNQEHIDKEIERAASRTEWVQQLKNSLAETK